MYIYLKTNVFIREFSSDGLNVVALQIELYPMDVSWSLLPSERWFGAMVGRKQKVGGRGVIATFAKHSELVNWLLGKTRPDFWSVYLCMCAVLNMEISALMVCSLFQWPLFHLSHCLLQWKVSICLPPPPLLSLSLCDCFVCFSLSFLLYLVFVCLCVVICFVCLFVCVICLSVCII